MLKIQHEDTLETLAYKLLGDTRLVDEVFIPGWNKDLPLPVGRNAYIKGLPIGPPAKNWTKPAEGRPRKK